MTTKRTKLDWKADEQRLLKATAAAEEIVGSMKLQEPIDPFAIAQAESPMLRMVCEDFGNQFDGQLEFHREKRRFLAFVNAKYDSGFPTGEHHPRTRFSAAHELGHYFLDRHRACLLQGQKPHSSKSEFTSDVMMEREADAFAAGLLMPSRLMRPIVNEADLTDEAVIDLASRFQASLVSAAIRAVQLSDFASAVVGIRDGNIAWSFQAPCLVEGGCYPPARGPIRSPTAQKKWGAFTVGEADRSNAQACVGEWFRTYDRDHLEQLSVTEYHLPVPVMNTLIVLLSVPEDELFPDDYD